MTRIYLVDDDPELCAFCARWLAAQRGYEVRTFLAVGDAIRAISRDPPDLLIVDFWLPGLLGIDLITWARVHSGFDLPIILLSAYVRDGSLVGAPRRLQFDQNALDADATLNKDRLDELPALIERLLRAHRSASPARAG